MNLDRVPITEMKAALPVETPEKEKGRLVNTKA